MAATAAQLMAEAAETEEMAAAAATAVRRLAATQLTAETLAVLQVAATQLTAETLVATAAATLRMVVAQALQPAVILVATQEEMLLLETAAPVPVVRTLRTAVQPVILVATLAVQSQAQVEALLMEAHHLAVVPPLVMQLLLV